MNVIFRGLVNIHMYHFSIAKQNGKKEVNTTLPGR